MLNKKSSVLMISLWILSILVILAISIGNRAAISLKLARNQRDGLKAYLCAKSGIYKAIKVLDNDENKDYDSFADIWSTGKDAQDNPIFDNVKTRDNYEGMFSVKYLYNKETNEYLCMADEERRININEVDTSEKKKILLELFKFAGIDEPDKLTELVVNWIDTSSQPGEDIFIKNQPLKIPEELLLILEYYYIKNNEDKANASKKAQEAYSKIKDLITVYPENGKININTVSEDVLKILANSIAQVDQSKHVNDIVKEIIEKRPFQKMGDVVIDVDAGSTNDDILVNNLKNYLDVYSRCFRIESTGSVGNINKKIIAIYNRKDQKIVYWHENNF